MKHLTTSLLTAGTTVTDSESSRSWTVVVGWLAGEGSNLQHPAPKAGVLPIELPAKGRCARSTVERHASINSIRLPKGSST